MGVILDYNLDFVEQIAESTVVFLCCECFLALVVESYFLRFIMVVFTHYCHTEFLYGGNIFINRPNTIFQVTEVGYQGYIQVLRPTGIFSEKKIS